MRQKKVKICAVHGSAVQGVQQPFEISMVTGIEEASGISLEVMVYPNSLTDIQFTKNLII
ncbi:MAG: hypothetical protein WCS03_07670 [Bacteroidota bacterium]